MVNCNNQTCVPCSVGWAIAHHVRVPCQEAQAPAASRATTCTHGLRALSAIALLVTCLPLASCREAETPRPDAAASQPAYELRKTFGAGPVTFTIELSRTTITTADSLKCRMTLAVAQGYEADFPDIAFPDDVPGSILTDYQEHTETENDRRIITRDYELEPEYEGKLTLPKMEVYSHRTGEVKEEVLETEPIEVTVKASRETPGDLELKGFRGLVTVEQMAAQERRTWPRVLAGCCVLAAIVAGILYLVRRPRPSPPPPPPHETALRRLRELADRGLSADRIEPFFVEVTGIVRDYIEQAFGVRAPEQTTEEFLAEMVTSPAVARHRAVLEPFLVAADEVKFACMRPDVAAMRRAFETAETFIFQSSGMIEAARPSRVRCAAEGGS